MSRRTAVARAHLVAGRGAGISGYSPSSVSPHDRTHQRDRKERIQAKRSEVYLY